MMDEDQKCWKDMAKLMIKINKKETDMFNIVHIKDQVTIYTVFSNIQDLRNFTVLFKLVYFICSLMVRLVGVLLLDVKIT